MTDRTYDAIIFDLDGTLLDTLQDIADAANEVLTERGWPTHPVDAYRFFVGGGVGHLMHCATPDEYRDVTSDVLVKIFREKYARNWRQHTKPYPGIPELLDAVSERGLKMSILSNKPDSFTKEFVAELLPHWRFERVFGRRANVPKKPDPTSTLDIAQSMATAPSEMLFVGDSAVDMQTAIAAGMFPVGVLWGFRPRSELEAGGAEVIIARPDELLQLL
jgi:phosphoglycolate phosphatase